MGQGTDSCGGYDVEYDPYDRVGVDGLWPQRNGTEVRISSMSVSHMRNAQRICRELASCATFTDEREKWESWVEVFEDEISSRERHAPKVVKPLTPAKPQRGTKVRMKCFCGCEYDARKADLDRGWALTCSKTCAAIRREYGRPAATKCKS